MTYASAMGVDVFDTLDESSMKCIRFDVCKNMKVAMTLRNVKLLNEVHTF